MEFILQILLERDPEDFFYNKQVLDILNQYRLDIYQLSDEVIEKIGLSAMDEIEPYDISYKDEVSKYDDLECRFLKDYLIIEDKEFKLFPFEMKVDVANYRVGFLCPDPELGRINLFLDGGYILPEDTYSYNKISCGVEYIYRKNKSNQAEVILNTEESMSAIDELYSLTGLESIKKEISDLVNFASVQLKREKQGLKSVPVSLHLVFSGNPGTGKTTVARILAKIYKEIGLLSSGHLVEVERADLVSGYVGHTALKTKEKIEEAMGGVLFIDEAYTLAKGGNDFGQEAIDTILKSMEDNREDFVVIVAGYTDEMVKFINSNPGLKSRFNKYIHFDDFELDELEEIFMRMCSENDYSVSDDAKKIVYDTLERMVSNKDESFANAREVRNYFDRIITNQSSRIAKVRNVDKHTLMTILKEDC